MKDDTVLDRWGLIAGYLKVSERTAMRYLELGLPIVFDPAGHPTTTPAKLDEWRYFEKRQQIPPNAE